MSAISVITDSNTCLPDNIIDRYHIKVLPLLLHFGEETFRDGIDIDTEEFYSRLKTADPFPITSAPKPEEFIEAFQEAQQDGAQAAIVVTLSSHLSATTSSVKAAVDEMESFPVAIIDSGLATAAEGFVALEAARAVDRGLPFDEAAAAARSSIPRCGFAFILSTLIYLYRGGRVPAIASMLGTKLGICPIVGNHKFGEVGILAHARGVERAREKMIEVIGQRIAGKPLRDLAVMHAHAPEQAAELREEVAARFAFEDCLITELSPVMGAHAGPDALGIAYQLAAQEE
jgi:DegV family protein with EDD domain